jgi:hypothetical protein
LSFVLKKLSAVAENWLLGSKFDCIFQGKKTALEISNYLTGKHGAPCERFSQK